MKKFSLSLCAILLVTSTAHAGAVAVSESASNTTTVGTNSGTGSQENTLSRFRDQQEAKKAAAKDRFTYNPAKCSTDAKGRIYLAFGKDVFQFPAERVQLWENFSQADALSNSPTSEQVGCPSNPIKDQWARVSTTLPLAKTSTGSDSQLIVNIGPWSGTPEQATFSKSQLQTEAKFTNACEKAASKEYADGLIECPVDAQSTNGRTTYAVYQARPERYSTPLGYKFTVETKFHNISTHHQIRYPVANTAMLSYGFTGDVVAPEQIIPIDRAVRAEIMAGKQSFKNNQ